MQVMGRSVSDDGCNQCHYVFAGKWRPSYVGSHCSAIKGWQTGSIGVPAGRRQAPPHSPGHSSPAAAGSQPAERHHGGAESGDSTAATCVVLMAASRANWGEASWGVVLLMALLSLVTSQTSQLELYYNALEEVAPNTFVGNVKTDSRIMERYSSSVLSSLRFRFLSQPSVEFSIDEPTGIIRTAGRIDRDTLCADEDVCSVTLDVVALVSEQMTFLEIIKVNVDIEDINDNWPQFPDTRISHQILESTNVGNGFVIPTAIDPDSGVNGIQDYELVSSSDKFQLSVVDKVDGSTDVRLVLIEPLDREAEDFYQVRVVAYDGGNPPKSGSVDVNIIVQDANDNDPMFDNVTYDVTIFENTPVDSTILRVHASDRDAGLYGQILYTFSDRTQNLYGNIFGIKNTTGDIYVKGEVDFEDDPVYHLVVTAFDRGPDSIPADATVIVRIQDINDNQPKITVNTLAATGTSSAEVLENAAPGLFVAHLTVMDPDDGINGEFNCTLNDNSFDLQLLYETEYKIVTRIPLDREKQDEYSLAIVCEDFGPRSVPSTKHITVVVTDDNDNMPLFNQDVYSTEIMENNEPNLYITQVNATDSDIGNNAVIHYRLHDNAGDGFYIDPTTGVITATKSFDREDNPRITFQVLAVDGGQPQRVGSATVVVELLDENDESPSFTHERYSFSLDENLPAGTEVGIVNAVDPDSDPYSDFSYGIVPGSGSGEENFVIDSHTGRITTTRQLDREEVSVYYLVIQAADNSSPPMSSTTTCTIYVSDKNDNEPVFEFPSESNNSIYISNRVPVNYVISRVQAVDRDIGDNGNLSYSLFQGNHLGFFRMDSTFGVISIAKSVKDIDYHVFELQLKVQDKGFPVKYAFADMNIVVNKTIPFPIVTTSHILGGHNFTIVVSLACVSGLIMVCLVIAIVVIRRQDAERRNHKYNCRMEALKMLHANQENHKEPELDSTSSKALSNGSCSSDCDKPKKEVSFNLDIDERDCVEYSHNHDKSRQSWPSTIDHRTLEVGPALLYANLYDHITKLPRLDISQNSYCVQPDPSSDYHSSSDFSADHIHFDYV